MQTLVTMVIKKGDAKATISRKEQQNQTVQAINNFIEKRLN